MLKVGKDPYLSVEHVPMNTDYPLDIDNEVIPNTPFTMFLVGKMGSGKTNLLLNLMLGTAGGSQFYNKVFDRVFFIGNVKTINSKTEIDLPEDQIFDELTLDVLLQIEDEIADSDEAVLLVIDDQTANLKKKGIKDKIMNFTYNMRHKCASGKKSKKKKPHGLHIIITAQKYNKIEKSVRVVGTHYALFKPSKTDSKEFMDEVLSIDKNTWVSIQKLVYDEPHNFLFYNAKKSIFYKNFDEIEMELENEFEI